MLKFKYHLILKSCFLINTERFLQDVLHIIFGYLDEESFVRAEFVSSAWKAAVSDGYPGKLWDKWLKKKV